MQKKTLIIIVVILSLSVFAVVGFFINHFGIGQFPKLKTEWGAAGDYFGGFLNPIIGLINLIVLIYITLLVSRKDDRRWTNDMIHSAHEELLTEIKKIEVGCSREVFSELDMYLLDFTYRNRWLFDDREEGFLKVMREFGKSLREVELSAIRIESDIVDMNYQLGRLIENDEGLMQIELDNLKSHCISLCLYNQYRIQLINYIRLTMIGKNPKKVFEIDKHSEARNVFELLYASKKRVIDSKK
jgi:uncharacterized membrane protein